MFEFLFKYPAGMFAKGSFVLLAPWPLWVLLACIVIAGGALLWHVRHNHGMLTGARPIVIWMLETAFVALLLFLLWHPALSIATLRTQQNVVAVLVDDSHSMSIHDAGGTRIAQATALLNGGLLSSLERNFQVRLYRFGKEAERIRKTGELSGGGNASRIGDSLKQVLSEASTLPLGAVVLLSDGADNSGGIDRDTIAQIRQRRIPVHTVGFGRERVEKDIELSDVVTPARALADSRLVAQVTLRQTGYSGQRARLSVRDGGKVLASQEIVLKGDGAAQTESLLFNAGIAGPKTLQFAVEPLAGEENPANNAVTRLVNVEGTSPRILYIEGEPRWEYKFLRRAVEDDRTLKIVSMMRTTQNKIYRQGLDEDKELEQGFPATPEELFHYQAIIVGSVEAGYFTPTQQELLREFVNRRGGGLLFLGGRASLADGGWQSAPIAEVLPVRLPDHKGTFHRDYSSVTLTAQGRHNIICRLEENAERNVERWKKMPQLADYEELGDPKPGAVVLLEVEPSGRKRQPLLVTQNYGRGRVAVFATGGSWRWQMQQDLADMTHEMFWRQLLRYLVSDTPGQVISMTPRPVLADETQVRLRAEVRDKRFQPDAGVRVEGHILGPEGKADTAELTPQALEEGVYTTEWTADKPGSYVVEIVAKRDDQEIGRDMLSFRREEGVAENFRVAQNRELLEKLAEQTGGRYYNGADARKLPGEISYSEAGITTRENRDLWDMPVIFLLALLLRGSEWLLRRKWGVV